MLDAPTEEIWGGSQSAYFVGQHVHQLGLRVRPTVGQKALEMIPDAFVGVQFRSVRGEGHQMKTARASEEFLHRIAAMDCAVVQQHDQMTTDLTQETAQEDGHLLALNVVLAQLAVQRAMEAPGADGDTGERGVIDAWPSICWTWWSGHPASSKRDRAVRYYGRSVDLRGQVCSRMLRRCAPGVPGPSLPPIPSVFSTATQTARAGPAGSVNGLGIVLSLNLH